MWSRRTKHPTSTPLIRTQNDMVPFKTFHTAASMSVLSSSYSAILPLSPLYRTCMRLHVTLCIVGSPSPKGRCRFFDVSATFHHRKPVIKAEALVFPPSVWRKIVPRMLWHPPWPSNIAMIRLSAQSPSLVIYMEPPVLQDILRVEPLKPHVHRVVWAAA